jgi:hypothetical protein
MPRDEPGQRQQRPWQQRHVELLLRRLPQRRSRRLRQLNRPLEFTFANVPAQAAPTAGSSGFTFAYDATNRRIGGTATDNSWWSYPAAVVVIYVAAWTVSYIFL